MLQITLIKKLYAQEIMSTVWMNKSESLDRNWNKCRPHSMQAFCEDTFPNGISSDI
jgi:hypothetical protein